MKRIGFYLVVGLFFSLGLGGCRLSISQAAASTEGVSVETPSFSVSETPTATLPAPPASATPLYLQHPPTASPTIATRVPPRCQEVHGRIERGVLDHGLLPNSLEYRLYLPPCYDQNLAQRYPVLYLIHGKAYNDSQWDDLGADETADTLIAAGEIPALIIVMPRDRLMEPEPPQDRFAEAVVQDLVPWIDQHYRTLPDRQYRAVGGLSRGGGWAVHFALKYWQDFSVLVATSPALFWNDTPYLSDWLDAIPLEKMPRIYIDVGAQDFDETLDSARWFEQKLTDKGIPHEWHLFQGGHNELYWTPHLPVYLHWVSEGWQELLPPSP